MADSALGTFRVDKDSWAKFQEIAKSGGTNASKLIVGFIDACLDNSIDINDYKTTKPKPKPENLSESIDVYLDNNLDARLKAIIGNRLDKSGIDTNDIQKMVNESIEIALEPIGLSVSEAETYTKSQIEAVRGEMMAVKKLSAVG
jgi:hypothetical protein